MANWKEADLIGTGYTDDNHVTVRMEADSGEAMRFHLNRLQALSVAVELIAGTVATTIDTLRTKVKGN